MGPLVVGCAAFQVPTGIGSLELSEGFKSAGARVGDSKRLYSQGGVKALEGPVLSFLRACGHEVTDLSSLARATGFGSVCWDEYPWYAASIPALPIVLSQEKIQETGDKLKDQLNRMGIGAMALQLRPVLEGEFNRRVRGTNKAWVLASAGAELLRFIVETCGSDETCDILCDRLGGRKYYSDLLSYVFGVRPEIDLETPEESRYRLLCQGKRISIRYRVGADHESMAVGLASMACKYVREIFMEALNGYWCEKVSGLHPTAGYPEDGARFLSEIGPFLTEQDRARLVRRC
jgi:hypothetical protein